MLLKIIGVFCKRALYKRRYSANETYNFKEPTNRSHPMETWKKSDNLPEYSRFYRAVLQKRPMILPPHSSAFLRGFARHKGTRTYIYKYLHIYMHMYICTYIYVYTYMKMSKYTFVYIICIVYTHICIHIYMDVSPSSGLVSSSSTFIFRCARKEGTHMYYKYIYICIYTYIHVCMYTLYIY